MKDRFVRLNAFTRKDRRETIADVRKIFAENHGWILDFHMFSNISINFNFEVSLTHLFDIVKALELIDLHFTRKSQELLQDDSKLADELDQTINCVGTLQITFVHDEPDLRQVIPAVPG